MTARALYWVTPEGNIGTFKQGTAFTYDFIATTDDETVAVTYAVTSTLPSGFTFSGSVLSATSAVVTGEHSFTISASATVNSTLTTVSRTFKIKVASYDFNLATGIRLGRINENSDYSLQLELEHTPGYSVRFKNGGLPQDMTISESGLISGKIINYSSLDDYQLWGLYIVVERINANNEIIDHFIAAPFIKVVKWLKWVTPPGRLGEFSAYDAVDIQLRTSYPTLFKRLVFSMTPDASRSGKIQAGLNQIKFIYALADNSYQLIQVGQRILGFGIESTTTVTNITTTVVTTTREVMVQLSQNVSAPSSDDHTYEFYRPSAMLPRGLSLSSTGRITGRISPEDITQTNEFTVTINGYDFGENVQHTTTRTFAIISNAWYQPRAGVYQSEIIGSFNQNKAMPVTKFAASPDSAGNITYAVSNAPSFVRFDRQSTVTVGGTTVQAISIFGIAPQVKEDTEYSFDLSIIKNMPASTATAQYVIAITQPLNGVPVTNEYTVPAKITNNGQTLVLDYPIVSNLSPSATITAKTQLQDKVVNVLSLNDRIVNLELPLYSDTRRFVFKVLKSTVPTWVTEPGRISSTATDGIFNEGSYQEFPFVAQPAATGDYIKYAVLNGTTPLGLALDTQGVLKGVLGEVATLTTYSFTIRATEYDQTDTAVGQADRSFSIQVAGATPPVFYTEPGMICNMAKLPDITTPSAKINSITVNGDNSVTVSISPFSLTAHGIVNNTCISFDGITGTGTSILNNNIFYAGNCDPANSSFKLYLNKGVTNPTNQFNGQRTWTFLRTGSVSGCAVDSEYFEAQLSAGTSDPGVTVEYSIVSGALPLGLSMNSSGKIIGYPTAKLETYDEQGVVSYSGAVDSNGNPAIKIGTFVVQASSESGNTQAQFSIAVVNQEYDWNLEQTLNGTNYQFGGRRPVIINNKPLSAEISISDINRPYYFTGNSLGTFKQDSQMQFKLIGKNFNATPDQEIDWETTYYISGIRTAQPDSSNAFVATATFNNADSNVVMSSLTGLSTAPAGGYITFFGQKVGNIASNAPENSFVDVSTSYKYVVTDATNKIINLYTTTGALITPEIGGTLFTRDATTLVSPNTNAIAANGWISGSLAAVTPDNAIYTINAQVQSPNLITSVSSTTTANIGSANLVVDKAYGFYTGQPVSVSGTTGSLSNTALYTISSIANTVSYRVDLVANLTAAASGTIAESNLRLYVPGTSPLHRYGTLDGIKANTRVQYVSTSPSANVTLYVDNLTQYGNTTVGTTTLGSTSFTFADATEKAKFATGDVVYFDANSNEVESNVPYLLSVASATNTASVQAIGSTSRRRFAASTGITMTKIAPTITLKYANGVAYVPSMSPTTIANITCQANVVTLRDTANVSVSPRITGNITLSSTATIPLISDVYEYTFLVAGDSKSTIGWNTDSELGTINNGDISRFKLDASFASDTVQTKAIFINNNKNIRLTTARSLSQDMPVKFIGTPVGAIGNIATFYINSIDSANNIIQLRTTETVENSLTPDASGNMTLTATIPDGRYKVTAGSLPPGLKLLSTGEIVGRVAFEQGTTVQTSNASQTYSFTVQAYSKRFPSSTLNRVFTIKTTQRHTGPYDNLYITGLMNADQRATVADLLSYINSTHNTSIKPDIYRPGDSNFGISKGLKYVHMYGVPSVPTDDFYTAYVEAIARNHYYKNLSLGELKTAVARDSTGAIVYELVYCEVVDNLQNTDGISITKEIIWGQSVSIDGVTPTQPVVYPNSLSNMRDQIEQKIGNINDSSVLPLWMLSTQADGKVPGFTQCWVLCYTKPGKSASVLATIKSYLSDNSLSMNSINFGMDRLMVDRALTHTYGVGGNESWPSYNARTNANVGQLSLGQLVMFDSSSVFGGIDTTKIHYVASRNNFSMKLARNSSGTTPVALTSGSGNMVMTVLPVSSIHSYTANAVSGSNITLTTAPSALTQGDVIHTGATVVSNLTANTQYYVAAISGNIIQLSSTRMGSVLSFANSNVSMSLTAIEYPDNSFQVVATSCDTTDLYLRQTPDITLSNVAGLRVNQKVKPLTTIGNFDSTTDYFITDVNPATSTIRVRTQLYGNIANTVLTPNVTANTTLVTSPLSSTLQDDTRDSFVVFYQSSPLDSTAS